MLSWGADEFFEGRRLGQVELIAETHATKHAFALQLGYLFIYLFSLHGLREAEGERLIEILR